MYLDESSLHEEFEHIAHIAIVVAAPTHHTRARLYADETYGLPYRYYIGLPFGLVGTIHDEIISLENKIDLYYINGGNNICRPILKRVMTYATFQPQNHHDVAHYLLLNTFPLKPVVAPGCRLLSVFRKFGLFLKTI